MTNWRGQEGYSIRNLCKVKLGLVTGSFLHVIHFMFCTAKVYKYVQQIHDQWCGRSVGEVGRLTLCAIHFVALYASSGKK